MGNMTRGSVKPAETRGGHFRLRPKNPYKWGKKFNAFEEGVDAAMKVLVDDLRDIAQKGLLTNLDPRLYLYLRGYADDINEWEVS